MEPWLIWLSVGAALLIIEMLTASFFLFCFAAGAGAASFFAAAGFGIGHQWTAFVLVSALAVAMSRRFFRRPSLESDRQMGVDALINQVAEVISPIKGQSSGGLVKVQGDQWSAMALDDDQNFEVGQKVLVVKSTGAKLLVKAKLS